MDKKPVSRTIEAEALGFQIRESYKKARTNITYSIMKQGTKMIAFTSTSKGEGKTVTAVNVASALAQQVGTRVLIVECDLRRPRVHTALSLDPYPGITNYLNFECTYEEIFRKTKKENLKAVCYGAIPPNPSELLASAAMTKFMEKVSTEFDFVIFDTPPVGVVVDSIPIIKNTDGVVVVVRNNSTTYPELNKTLDFLKRSDSRILGIIVNRVKADKIKKSYKNGSYGYYGY